MPTRQFSGMPRIARERVTTSWSRALPTLARCERPTRAAFSAATVQPGRLAQGPEEKQGLAGRTFGFMAYSFQNSCDPLGGRVPPMKLGTGRAAVNCRIAVAAKRRSKVTALLTAAKQTAV